MAFLDYVRVVSSGTLRANQSWSMGFSFLTATSHTQSELLTWLGTVDSALKTFYGITSIQTNCWDTTTSYQRVAAYQYTAAGGATSQAQIFSSGVTGLGTAGAPAQLALVISTRSGIGGRSKRGRCYLPLTCTSAIGNTGQVSSTHVTNIATAFKTLIDSLNASTIGGAAITYGIASRASGFTVAGQDCKVDSKVDTQRRRTDKIVAANSSVQVF